MRKQTQASGIGQRPTFSQDGMGNNGNTPFPIVCQHNHEISLAADGGDARHERILKKVKRIDGEPCINSFNDKPAPSAVKRVRVNLDSESGLAKKKIRMAPRYEPMYYSFRLKRMVKRSEYWKECGLAHSSDEEAEQESTKELELIAEKHNSSRTSTLEVQLNTRASEAEGEALLLSVANGLEKNKVNSQSLTIVDINDKKCARGQDEPNAGRMIELKSIVDVPQNESLTESLNVAEPASRDRDSDLICKGSSNGHQASLTSQCASLAQPAQVDNQEETPQQPSRLFDCLNYETPTKKQLNSQTSTAVKDPLQGSPTETAESVVASTPQVSKPLNQNPFILEKPEKLTVVSLASLIQGYSQAPVQQTLPSFVVPNQLLQSKPSSPYDFQVQTQSQTLTSCVFQVPGMELQEQPAFSYSNYATPNPAYQPNYGVSNQQQVNPFAQTSYYQQPIHYAPPPPPPPKFCNTASSQIFGGITAMEMFQTSSKSSESLFAPATDPQKDRTRPQRKIELAFNKKNKERVY